MFSNVDIDFQYIQFHLVNLSLNISNLEGYFIYFYYDKHPFPYLGCLCFRIFLGYLPSFRIIRSKAHVFTILRDTVNSFQKYFTDLLISPHLCCSWVCTAFQQPSQMEEALNLIMVFIFLKN